MGSEFKEIARRAADRYADASIPARHFAYGKMTGDPVYERALREGVLPSRGTVVDIGCGQGLMLVLLDELSRFDRRIGIELRPRMAYLARAALGARAEIVEGDARKVNYDECSAVLMFDVLQMMSPSEQEDLLSTIARALRRDGVLLVRDADASAGWRYQLVKQSNQLKSYLIGTSHIPRHYRTRHDWLACFTRLGLAAEVCETPSRNPLANVLFRLTKR